MTTDSRRISVRVRAGQQSDCRCHTAVHPEGSSSETVSASRGALISLALNTRFPKPATCAFDDRFPAIPTSLTQESTHMSEVFLTQANWRGRLRDVTAGEVSPETLLDQGVQALAELLGPGWTIRRVQRQGEGTSFSDQAADALLEVTPEGTSPYTEFLIDLKSKISPRQAEEV